CTAHDAAHPWEAYRATQPSSMENPAKMLHMQAARDMIVQSNTFRKQVAATLLDWERATGMQICFRQMSRAWKLPDGDRVLDLPLSQHRSDFCEAVKRRRLPACMKDDNIDLPSLFPPETAGMA